jgi:hypothetical protein
LFFFEQHSIPDCKCTRAGRRNSRRRHYARDSTYKYTATITGSAAGGLQRAATFDIDVKARPGPGPTNGILDPTMLAIIIGAAAGGGALIVLKRRARTGDQSIP